MHYFMRDDGYRMTSVRFNIPITGENVTAAAIGMVKKH
jgi:hypothetical protein